MNKLEGKVALVTGASRESARRSPSGGGRVNSTRGANAHPSDQ